MPEITEKVVEKAEEIPEFLCPQCESVRVAYDRNNHSVRCFDCGHVIHITIPGVLAKKTVLQTVIGRAIRDFERETRSKVDTIGFRRSSTGGISIDLDLKL